MNKHIKINQNGEKWNVRYQHSEGLVIQRAHGNYEFEVLGIYKHPVSNAFCIGYGQVDLFDVKNTDDVFRDSGFDGFEGYERIIVPTQSELCEPHRFRLMKALALLDYCKSWDSLTAESYESAEEAKDAIILMIGGAENLK